MKSFFKAYFNMTSRERNGTLLLAAILFILIVIYAVRPAFEERELMDFSAFEDQVDAFSQSSGLEATLEAWGISEADTQTIRYFEFDPNNLPADDWKRLGLTDKQISNIHNYEKAGGQFRKPADLKKVYAVNDQLYAELEPFIRIEKSFAPSHQHQYRKKWSETNGQQAAALPDYRSFSEEGSPKTKTLIDINLADTVHWRSVYGIGPLYANRILKYRDLLGGFTHVEQLKEVYGLRDSTYYLIVGQLACDTAKVSLRKININTADFKTLVRHPYIDKNLANSLVMYRNRHGRYKKVEDIRKSDLVTPEIYLKIVPYLKVDDSHGNR